LEEEDEDEGEEEEERKTDHKAEEEKKDHKEASRTAIKREKKEGAAKKESTLALRNLHEGLTEHFRDYKQATDTHQGIHYYDKQGTSRREAGVFHNYEAIKVNTLGFSVGQKLPPNKRCERDIAGVGYIETIQERAHRARGKNFVQVVLPFVEVRFTQANRPPHFERCFPAQVLSRREWKDFEKKAPALLGAGDLNALLEQYRAYQEQVQVGAPNDAPPTAAKKPTKRLSQGSKRAAENSPRSFPPKKPKRRPNIYALWTRAVQCKLKQRSVPEGETRFSMLAQQIKSVCQYRVPLRMSDLMMSTCSCT
jgi:hypothetical protein